MRADSHTHSLTPEGRARSIKDEQLVAGLSDRCRAARRPPEDQRRRRRFYWIPVSSAKCVSVRGVEVGWWGWQHKTKMSLSSLQQYWFWVQEAPDWIKNISGYLVFLISMFVLLYLFVVFCSFLNRGVWRGGSHRRMLGERWHLLLTVNPPTRATVQQVELHTNNTVR